MTPMVKDLISLAGMLKHFKITPPTPMLISYKAFILNKKKVLKHSFKIEGAPDSYYLVNTK